MNQKNYEVKGAVERIAHIKSHLDVGFTVERMNRNVHNIQHNLGNPRACAMTLSSHAQASAMYAWFEYHDLDTMQQWCYVASKLDQMWYQMEVDTTGPGGKMAQLLQPLLSNNDALIDWFAHYDQAYDMERVESHKTHDFWAYQAVLALRGEWSRLIERCERIIADPPATNAEQKYLMDHHFYLALARHDIGKMQEILEQIVTSKAVRARSDDDSGFTADLISTAAVVYAKIAWRHGYQVKVDTPYIPAEWLPVKPLVHYDNHYGFLK